MRPWQLLLGLIFLLSSCATSHYYRQDNGKVSLFIRQPEAHEVFFLCSLDRYQRHETEKMKNGVWKIELPSSQTFRYFYLIDDKVVVPECGQSEKDDFGSGNCIYAGKM